MSLILDALRKADAERERGSVPSLHSQPVAPDTAQTPPKQQAPRNWLWVGIGLAAGLAGAAAWVLLSRDAAPPTAPVARSDTTPSGAPTVAAPTAPGQVAPPPASPSVTAGAPPSIAPLPTDAARPADPAPWRPAEERREPPPDAKGAAPTSAASPAGGVSNADSTVYPIDQLPSNIRSQVPQLVIGGSIYSPSASGRSLIVNGQLYRERERLTPDLTLEEIKLKAAVFSFRGYRFEVLF